MDLGLEGGDGGVQFFESRGCFVGRGGDFAAKYGNAGFAEEVFGLVFVDFHSAGKGEW